MYGRQLGKVMQRNIGRQRGTDKNQTLTNLSGPANIVTAGADDSGGLYGAGNNTGEHA